VQRRERGISARPGINPDSSNGAIGIAYGSCDRPGQRTVEGIKTLTDKGVTVYAPTAAELAQFRAATQQPVIGWLKTKVAQKRIDGMLAAGEDAEAKK
jgi:hypothetical protein